MTTNLVIDLDLFRMHLNEQHITKVVYEMVHTGCGTLDVVHWIYYTGSTTLDQHTPIYPKYLSLRPMKKLKTYAFSDFLSLFPVVDLPIQLNEDSIFDFERVNPPFPIDMIMQFIVPIENEQPGEFTEYVPCFRLPQTTEFEGIVYWKAELMRYQYVLATFDKKGVLIKHATIAGTQSDGEYLLRSVANIDKDWIIDIVEGTNHTSSKVYDPNTSNKYSMEVVSPGEIIFLQNEPPN